ncbi:LAO/AO ABC transporter ATP-binding protein [Methyloceanibacter stevinii]|uniref:LAO/AO ABC transporter ATP-binding protein n=1 Tax=Methyloceanibacter stevinii TaxID=1774970 RepID=A0A1E3VNZ1_9HYPH|nr:methylmalonyl Co-A mutase-associated GTPase MeaB [Methyloceanibacter stevinii]ODR95253.1 LAO/AO ABC transporter ATP-binding protein [Methyloceanibacter stevinii]
MSRYAPSSSLLGRAKSGETAAIARLISRAEAGVEEVRETLAGIYQLSGSAHVIGITGVPGSGKSTLVAALAGRLRKLGMKVGIVAVDPSSPYTGGSILGDRIRMTDIASDPGIYIRSMATRGAVGGLARATLEATDILDIGGFDTIIVETVGVGQDEVEIAKASNTTIVVSAPGLGDDVQAIKAGMLEIADIHVVSKCDRSDASRTITDLKTMLMLGLKPGETPDWNAPVVGISSYTGDGFDELIDALTRHRKVAFDSESGRKRRLAIARYRLHKTAETLLIERFTEESRPHCSALAQRLSDRQADPYSLANELVTASLEKGIFNR